MAWKPAAGLAAPCLSAKPSSRKLTHNPGNSSWNGMGWEEPAAGWPVLRLCQDQPGHRGRRWGGCPWCPQAGFALLSSPVKVMWGCGGPPCCSHTHLGVRAACRQLASRRVPERLHEGLWASAKISCSSPLPPQALHSLWTHQPHAAGPSLCCGANAKPE